MAQLIEVVSVNQNRVTIPKTIREKLCIKNNSRIAWREDNARYFIEKVE